MWPHGHPAIPRIPEFPEIRNPHLDIYRGFTSAYAATDAAGWAIGGRPPAAIPRSGVLSACLDYGTAIGSGSVPAARAITAQTAVRCAFSSSFVIDTVERTHGVVDIYVRAGKRVLATGHLTPTSAALNVPRRGCTLGPVPH